MITVSGKFGGLQKIDVEGKKQEAIKLAYGDRDILYVSIHSLHKISISMEKMESHQRSTSWVLQRGKKSNRKLRKESRRLLLISFSCMQNENAKRIQYAPDTHMQHELEASFLFEDTPDQFSATQDVKKRGNQQPMDRLIFGDVGFGKTRWLSELRLKR